MNLLRNISVAFLALLALCACQNHKKHHQDFSQQQEFPIRTVGSVDSESNNFSEQATDTLVDKQRSDSSLNKDDTEKPLARNNDDAVPIKHSSKEDFKANKGHKHHSEPDVTYAEQKTADELEVEYHDVFGDSFLDHIDDEEYDAAEEYGHEDHWQKMPPEIVQQRPVAPRGKFRKFDPRDL